MSGHFCQKCGDLLEEGDIFCHSCGAEQHSDISGGSEITPEAAPVTGAPEIANEPAPPSEHGKFCAFCGAPMHLGDRFCEKCGKDQSAASGHAEHPNKKKKNGGRVRKKNSPLGLVFLAIFWSLLGFGFYTAYKTFWNDIPWNEVMAVVTGRRADTADDYSEGPASDRTEDLPPIAPAVEGQDAQSSGDVRAGGAPAAEERAVWTERDSAGRSRLVIIGEGGERPASLPGSVTGTRIRVRAEPNSNSKILGVLSRGDILEVIGRYSSGRGKFHWYNVNHGDLSGWMYGEYVRVEEKEN
jgi:hypothetical protein